MTKTREELVGLLATLKEQVPQLVQDHPDDGDFWANFACASDFILDEAGPEDFEYVLRHVDLVLEENGKLPRADFAPSDDLPPPQP
jgi:hypothetical protein